MRGIRDKLPLWTDKLPDLPEAVSDIARFYQHETHRLQYKPVLNEKLTKKTPHWGRKLLGATFLVCTTLIGLTSPYAYIIQSYSIEIMAGGLVMGLWLLFKK